MTHEDAISLINNLISAEVEIVNQEIGAASAIFTALTGANPNSEQINQMVTS